MPLFIAEYKMMVVVQAENKDHAEAVALAERREAFSDDIPQVSVYRKVLSLEDLPPYWDGMCLPYGGDGFSRIKDFLS